MDLDLNVITEDAVLCLHVLLELSLQLDVIVEDVVALEVKLV